MWACSHHPHNSMYTLSVPRSHLAHRYPGNCDPKRSAAEPSPQVCLWHQPRWTQGSLQSPSLSRRDIRHGRTACMCGRARGGSPRASGDDASSHLQLRWDSRLRSYRHLTRRDAYPSAVVAAANDHEITPTVTKKTLHLIDGLHHDYKYPNGPGRVHGHDEYLPGPTPHSQDEIDNAAHAGAPLDTPANEDLDAISTSAKTGLQLSYRHRRGSKGVGRPWWRRWRWMQWPRSRRW
jgi:hypothetical protein